LAETNLDRWGALRSKIVHEDSWIQQRVGWLLAANGFLFAALAALFAAKLPSQSTLFVTRLCLLLAIPVAGTLFSISTFLGLLAARRAMEDVESEYETVVPNAGSRSSLPQLRSTGKARKLGTYSSSAITLGAALIWLLILSAMACGLLPFAFRLP